VLINPNEIFVFDTDIISQLYLGEKLGEIPILFPKNKKIVLDVVVQELRKHSNLKIVIDNLIHTWRYIEEVPFPINFEIQKEYAHLTSPLIDRGKGESACMAYCKYNKYTLASSNLKDVGQYCRMHNIKNIAIMDLIEYAYEIGIWDESNCNEFISKLISKGERIPCQSLGEYFAKKKAA